MEEAQIRQRIKQIFDTTRIDYEGVFEPEAENLLVNLILEIKGE